MDFASAVELFDRGVVLDDGGDFAGLFHAEIKKRLSARCVLADVKTEFRKHPLGYVVGKAEIREELIPAGSIVPSGGCVVGSYRTSTIICIRDHGVFVGNVLNGSCLLLFDGNCFKRFERAEL